MHEFLEWLRWQHGDQPPEGEVDAKDIDEEIPDELADGYTPIEGSDEGNDGGSDGTS